MSAEQSSLPLTPSLFPFARHGRVGSVGQRAGAPHGRHRGRALLHQEHAHRGDQPRPGHHLLPDRVTAAGPAQHGSVAELRPRKRESEPARVPRPDLPGQGRSSLSTPGSGAAASCPAVHQGVELRSAGDPVLFLNDPAGLDRADRQAMLQTLDRLHRIAGRADPGSRDPDADRPVRDGVPDADLGARGHGLPDEPDSVYDLYGPDAREPGHLCRQLPAGPPPGRARRPFHPALPSGVGPARQPAPTTSRGSAGPPTRPRRRW